MISCSLLLVSVGAFVATYASQENNPWPPPPSYTEKAKMARYLVHYGDWGVMAVVSPDIGYVPFGTIQSYVDGPIDFSTGTPYLYISNISDTYKYMTYNNSASLTVSMAESEYCKKYDWDPMEPVCARVMATGLIGEATGDELTFAKKALFERHPAMAGWPVGHGFHVYKLKLTAVYLFDYYGGASHLTLQEYFAAKP